MSNICPFPQHERHIADAIAVALNVDAHPDSRLMAWCALKTARGQTVRQDRLRRMRVQVRDADAIHHPALIGGAA